MNTFLLAAALLLLLVLLRLWWTLWRQPPAERQVEIDANKALYQERAAEIERQFKAGEIAADDKAILDAENARRLLAEADQSHAAANTHSKRNTILVLAMALLLPLLAGVLYSQIGAYREVQHWQNLNAADMQHGESNMRDALLLLRTRLHQDPDDVEGWYMLGRSYMSLNRPQEAMQAFANAYRIDRQEPDYVVAYAQSMRMADPEGSLEQVDRLLAEALRLQPEHEGARILSAYRALERGEYQQAINAFRWLRERHQQDSSATQAIDQLIAEAEQKLKAETAPANASEPAATANAIEVRVELAPELQEKLPRGGRVFVYAKAEQGPPMPLAVAVVEPSSLPTTVTLSDQNAMNPAFKLSDHQRVQLIARVSASGKVEPAAGDLQGDSQAFDWRQAPKQTLVINRSL